MISHGSFQVRAETPQSCPKYLRDQIGSVFSDLEACDYRIHPFLTKSLAKIAAGKCCSTCVENAAFQLVFAHILGFGTGHGEGKIAEYLAQCQRTWAEVENAVRQLIYKAGRPEEIMALLAEQGYRSDLLTTYEQDDVITEAASYYCNALRKRESMFGPFHFSTLRLHGLVIKLLRKTDQTEEALRIALQMDQVSDKLSVADRIEIKAELVSLTLDLGVLDQAERFAQEVNRLHADFYPNKTTEAYENLRMLARIYLRQGKLDAALPVAENVLASSIAELGESHRGTTSSRRLLAQIHEYNGELGPTIHVYEQILKFKWHDALEVEIDADTIRDFTMLGLGYFQTDQLDLAAQCHEKLRSLVENERRVFKIAVNTINNFVTALLRRGDYSKCAEMFEKLLSEITRIQGPSCQEAALVMGNRAWIHARQGEHDRAEILGEQVVNVRRDVLGQSHTDTISAIGDLREAQLAQGRFEAAYETSRKEVKAVVGRPNESLKENVIRVEIIPESFMSAGAYAQALRLYEQDICFTESHSYILSDISWFSTISAAICHLCLADLTRAKAWTIKVLLRVPTASTENIERLMIPLLDLTKRFLEHECTDVGEQILALVLLMHQQVHSIPETLSSDIKSAVRVYLDLTKSKSLELHFDPAKLQQDF